MEVVVEGMQLHVKAGCLSTLFIFLSSVLLVADECAQRGISDVESIVAHGFVVVNLLKGERLAVVGAVVVALAFSNTWCQVEVAEFQVRVSPIAVVAGGGFSGALSEACADYIVVEGIVVVVRHLVRPPSAVEPAVGVAAEVDRVAKQSCIALIFCGCTGCLSVAGHHRVVMENDHACHGIAAIHE